MGKSLQLRLLFIFTIRVALSIFSVSRVKDKRLMRSLIKRHNICFSSSFSFFRSLLLRLLILKNTSTLIVAFGGKIPQLTLISIVKILEFILKVRLNFRFYVLNDLSQFNSRTVVTWFWGKHVPLLEKDFSAVCETFGTIYDSVLPKTNVMLIVIREKRSHSSTIAILSCNLKQKPLQMFHFCSVTCKIKKRRARDFLEKTVLVFFKTVF